MIIEVPEHIEPAEQLGRVHFVGIGGAALSGLARVMAQRGVAVSGSDARDSALLDGLRAMGVVCHVGHAPEHVDGADTVVVSTAVSADNVEVVRARQLGLRLWPRAAAVQSLLLGHDAVVVTGTHGKTTTTSMLTTALLACGVDPSYLIGSTLNSSGLNAAAGSGRVFVAEGDESDGAILAYTPVGAVVTNIEADHLDHFGTAEAYAAVFDEFAARILPGGFLVCCADDAGAARLAGSAPAGLAVDTVGLTDGCDLVARDLAFAGSSSTFSVWRGGERLGEVSLRVPGTHYVLDALGALAAGLRLGLGFDELAAGLGEFTGSGRRMEFKGEAAGVAVYDSYAHHPTEIAADTAAARALVPAGGRLVVCFQPHLFSRTRIFAAEMGAALGAADQVVVMDVYPAREQPITGVDGSLVSGAVPLGADAVEFVDDKAAVPAALLARARSGDLVLTLGAGDVTEIGPRLLELLHARHQTVGPQ